MPTVYIESTVISYRTARPSRDLVVATHQQLTLEWWDNVLQALTPFVSQFVWDEIARGDAEAVARRVKAIEGIASLEMSPPIAELAREYFDAIRLPETARTDAIHVALAVYHGLDYLVTWNCKHIAGGRVRAIVQQINERRGIATPVICTPEELMEV